MNKTTRRTIKHLVDRAVRGRVQAFIDSGEIKTCSGCGGDADVQTAGCTQCSERARSRRRHARTRSAA